MYKIYKVEVENQQNKKLMPLDLIVAVSTMADATNQVDVQNHLSIFERVALSLSILCQGHLVKIVLLRI